MALRTEHTPDLGMAEAQVLAGTCDTHITKPAFFFETTAGFHDTALVREQSVLHAHDKHHWKLQALGRVQRHQLHTIIPGFTLGFSSLQ